MAAMVGIRVAAGDLARTKTALAVVNLLQGAAEPGGATAAVDAAAGGVVRRALRRGDFTGKRGECLLLYPEAADAPMERVLVVGLGAAEGFDAEAAREVGGAIARQIRALKVKEAATVLHGADEGAAVEDLARGLAEGIQLGLYRYDAYFRDGRAEALAAETVLIIERDRRRVKPIERGVRLGNRVASSMNTARDLVNGPPNEVTPTFLAERAKRLGKELGFKVTVLDRKDCERLGMGSFLAVAQGSQEPCKFVAMEYEGASNKGTVCLVGKGITFDTGGISIKPAADMDLMKFDMGGSAAVIAAMEFAASHELPLRVVGIFAATENMPGGRAYKPGDILTSMSGVTIDVKNTDAEGRLILADALSYAERYEPDAVIDIATLTGACVIALGTATAAMGNDEWLLDAVTEAAVRSGERVWPMPLWKEYREKVKSSVADIRNSAGRDAGALTAGAFLGAFTNKYRWVHLDIAGAAWHDKPTAYMEVGGAAGSVRTLCQLLLDWKKPKGKGPEPGPRTSLRELPANAPAGGAAEPSSGVRNPARLAGGGPAKRGRAKR